LPVFRADVQDLAGGRFRVILRGHRRDHRLDFLEAETGVGQGPGTPFLLKTSAGIIRCFHHSGPEEGGTVVWVGAAPYEPAGGLYTALSQELAREGISSLRLHCRAAPLLEPCILDTVTAAAFLVRKKAQPVVLVGHSFAGAVVIDAAALRQEVAAVAALSSQVYGADLVGKVAPRPLLLVHGQADQILPFGCSEALYAWAGAPRELVLYPGAGHGLGECRSELKELLKGWLLRQVLRAPIAGN